MCVYCGEVLVLYLVMFAQLLQGILFSSNECVKSINDLVRLWLHEASRVYGDKLIEDKVVS